MTLETLITFSFAAFLLSISPGPSNLYIMARGIAQGPIAGIAAACGMAMGSAIFVIATALGIAAIFTHSPTAYLLLKLVGAAYLIYLGVQYFQQAQKLETKQALKPASYAHICKQSILVELTNPKSALFFIAFLPQFVDTNADSVAWQLVILGIVYALIALSCDLVVALMSGKIGHWLSTNQAFVYWQDRVAGGLLMSLGSYLAFEGVTETR